MLLTTLPESVQSNVRREQCYASVKGVPPVLYADGYFISLMVDKDVSTDIYSIKYVNGDGVVTLYSDRDLNYLIHVCEGLDNLPAESYPTVLSWWTLFNSLTWDVAEYCDRVLYVAQTLAENTTELSITERIVFWSLIKDTHIDYYNLLDNLTYLDELVVAAKAACM